MKTRRENYFPSFFLTIFYKYVIIFIEKVDNTMKRTQKFADIIKTRNPGCIELDNKTIVKKMGKINKTLLFTIGGIGAIAFASGLLVGKVGK